jgi:hypothetical protein
MSKMGRAIFWIQEQGLEQDKSALQKYVVYANKTKKKNEKDPKK